MLLITAAYLGILALEWSYLQTYTRKPRTKRVVLGAVLFSYAYNMTVYLTREWLPSPDSLLTKLLAPIQKLLLK